MKTTTVTGTKVEIVGIQGCNLVTVNVVGRGSRAQVNAEDLLKPEGVIPEELAELKFYDPVAAALKAEKEAKAKALAFDEPESIVEPGPAEPTEVTENNPENDD